jgi:hypothetical protein
MQYLLIISHDSSFTPTETLIKDIGSWIKKMERRGVRVYGNPLRPPGDATTVRVREGKVVLTKGPFAKSKEKMCAYEKIGVKIGVRSCNNTFYLIRYSHGKTFTN